MDNLLEQLEQWNKNDEFSRCIEVHFEDGTEETFEKGITLRQIWHEDVL